MTALTVIADDGTSERYGKSVSDLQTDVVFGNGKITGTSKYVTGYTGYSSVVADQDGNFISFTFESEDGASVLASLDGEDWKDVTDDGYVVARVNNRETLYVKATVDGKDDNVMTFSLSELVLEILEPEEELTEE